MARLVIYYNLVSSCNSPGVMCQCLSSARVALPGRRPVSSLWPRAPHTRSRTLVARGSAGPRAPPIDVSGGGEAPACGAQLRLREVGHHEQLGSALDQEGGGDGGVLSAGGARDPCGGHRQQVHRSRAHRRWRTDIHLLAGHTHQVGSCCQPCKQTKNYEILISIAPRPTLHIILTY